MSVQPQAPRPLGRLLLCAGGGSATVHPVTDARADSAPAIQTDVRGVSRAATSAILPPLITVWLVWGSTYLAIAVLVQTLPPLIGNALRFSIAALILAVVLVLVKGPRVLAITRAQLWNSTIMGVTLLGVGIGTVSMAERYVPSGIAALLVSVTPLWIIMFRLRAGDRPSRLTLAGVVVGMLGLVAMLIPGGTASLSGSDGDAVLWSIVILVGSFSWALFSWRSSSYDLPRNLLTTTFYEMFTASIFLTVVGLLIGERFDPRDVSNASWMAVGFLVLASLIAYSAYVWLIGHAPMSLVATYAYVNPIVAVFLGWLILGEPLTRDVLIGLTIVVGGVVLVVSGERRPRLSSTST